MNYIGLLTKEEKSTLCEIITGKEFKELFQKHEQEFSKLQKGFRAKSLKDKQSLSIAKAHVDKPFVAMQVNTLVEHWLNDIDKNMAKLEKEGLSHESALATSMLDSVFVDHVELYLKLIDKSLDGDAYSRLCDRMEDIKAERARLSEKDEQIAAMAEENQRLSEQVKKIQHSIDDVEAACASKVKGIEQDKEQLKTLLDEAQAKIAELQTAPDTFANDDAEYLAQFDDTNNSILPSPNTDEVVSLCCVASGYNGQKWLIRYADLKNDGHYYIFRRNKDIPPHFENRNQIFYKDGPSKDGSYGLWTWSAVPNENDSSKDYVRSQYISGIDAIEMVIVSEVANLDDLVNLLKGGIKCTTHSQKIMFAFCTPQGQYNGILCTAKDLTPEASGKATISPKCIVVPVYDFTNNDILHLDNGLLFYRDAFAGLPNSLYHLKSPLDITKSIVMSSISWSTYKKRKITRDQYKTFKDFMDAIPVDDITCKIRVECRCSAPAAKELLDKFLNIAWKYVEGDSLEDQIILSAISANTELQERTKALIRQDWEKENENLLADAETELQSLHEKLQSASDDLNKAKEAFKETQEKDEQLSRSIAEKEQLAENVENAVAERIQKARANAADFIASMAFVGGQPIQISQAPTPTSADAALESDIPAYCVHPELEPSDSLEPHHSWEDVINTAVLELEEAGVATQYQHGLAAFLCAAYIEKQPLLLVGPNAIDIAQAFCFTVTAHKHGTLYCEGDYVRQAIEKIGADDEKVVIINNLLTGGWLNRLPEILSNNDIFYIATHPYAEDIQVEPRSMYGFMLPLFTEFFVDKKATGKYDGGYFADDFKSFSPEKVACKGLTGLSKLSLSPLVRSNIIRLAARMHDIYPKATADDDFLFCTFPIAYASMETNELAEVLADPQKGIAISASLKRDLRHVFGEI